MGPTVILPQGNRQQRRGQLALDWAHDSVFRFFPIELEIHYGSLRGCWPTLSAVGEEK